MLDQPYLAISIANDVVSHVSSAITFDARVIQSAAVRGVFDARVFYPRVRKCAAGHDRLCADTNVKLGKWCRHAARHLHRPQQRHRVFARGDRDYGSH